VVVNQLAGVLIAAWPNFFDRVLTDAQWSQQLYSIFELSSAFSLTQLRTRRCIVVWSYNGPPKLFMFDVSLSLYTAQEYVIQSIARPIKFMHIDAKRNVANGIGGDVAFNHGICDDDDDKN
jgi:hypothetical protein